MEKVFKRSFQPSHYHAISQMGEGYLSATEVFLAIKVVKTEKAAGCDDIPPEMLKALNR